MKLDKYKLVYRGSVKNLYEVEKAGGDNPGVYLFEFTDDYSVFDYGKMPDILAGKGAALTLMSANTFERLGNPAEWEALAASDVWKNVSDADVKNGLLNSKTFFRLKNEGLRTHYRGVRDENGKLVRTTELKGPTNIMEVSSVRVIRPVRKTKGEKVWWDYGAISPGTKNYLIPLENVFRFGLPKGSSLLERFAADKNYAKTLGLKGPAPEGRWLPRPVMEFSSKLEPSDRYMMPDEALKISGLANGEFDELKDLTLLIAMFLMNLFSKIGVELWDGKIEFLKIDRIVMGDSVTPDELRLLKNGVQISKEPLRQYYKKNHPDFIEKIKKAKKIANDTERETADVLREDFDCEPAMLNKNFKRTVESMYTALTQELTGLRLFPNLPSLDEVIVQLESVARRS